MRALRGILIVVAVLIVLGVLAIAGGSMWLNSYIHSDAFRRDIEAKASESLGGPVTIEKIDFDIFNGIKLQGFATQLDPQHAGGAGALQVSITRVKCSYAWTELFSRKLKLTGITLDQPKIVLTKGGGRVETAEPLPTGPETNSATQPASVRTPSASTTNPPVSGPNEVAGPADKSMPFQFILDRAQVDEGTASVLDEKGAVLVELQGIDVDADTAGYYSGKDLTGKVKVATILLPSNLKITDFSTPVTYREGSLAATPFKASAFGGNIAGGYQLGSAGPSVLDLYAKGLQMEQLSEAAMGKSTARLTGSLDLQSKWRGVESGNIQGEGDATLADGKLMGVRILQDISQILKIKELDEPIIKSAKAHFVVQDRKVDIIGLQLESAVFRLTGDGTIAFAGPINANLVLILDRGAMAKLPQAIAASFVQQPDGTGSIAFHVSGTTSRPETDLATRLLMQNTKVKDVINKALNKFFH